MKIIPKSSKVKTYLYRDFTWIDVLIIFCFLGFIALVISSNLDYKFLIAGALLLICITLLLKIDDDRLYVYFIYLVKYIFSNKYYDEYLNLSVDDICIYDDVINDLIINKDGTFVGVIEIKPINFAILSEVEQDRLINGTLNKILRNYDGGRWMILSKSLPLEYYSELEEETKRLDKLAKLKEANKISLEEYQSRVNIIESRMNVIDAINSSSFYSPHYFLAFISSSKEIVNKRLDEAISTFINNGMNAYRVAGDRLINFVNTEFNEDDVNKEFKLPTGVKFNFHSTRIDEKNLNFLVLKRFPLQVNNGWLSSLMNLEHVEVIVKLNPIDKLTAIKNIDKTIMEVSSNSVRLNSEEINRSLQLETLNLLLENLQIGNDELFNTTVIIKVFDEYKSSVNKDKVKMRLKELGFGFDFMVGRQLEVFSSSSIANTDEIKVERGIPLSTVAAAFPFIGEVVNDQKGILIGESDLPAYFNFFKRDDEFVNSNMVVFGKSGSGKSYATKMLLSNFASLDHKIFILDPENEYSKLTKFVCGESIDVSDGSKSAINPLEIIKGIDEGDAYSAHLRFLESFFKLLLKGMSEEVFELLSQLLSKLYFKFNIGYQTNLDCLNSDDYPLFSDLEVLLNEVIAIEKDDYLLRNYKILKTYLDKFFSGRYSSLWNHHTNIDLSSRFITFDFQKLLSNKNDVVANAQMLLILHYLEIEVLKNRGNREPLIIALDEAHLFIDENYPIALDFINQLAKRIRKYNGMLIMISQNIKDFMGNSEMIKKTSSIIANSQYSLLFALSPNDLNDLKDLYSSSGSLSSDELEVIGANGRGSCYLLLSPKKRINLHVLSLDEFDERF